VSSGGRAEGVPVCRQVQPNMPGSKLRLATEGVFERAKGYGSPWYVVGVGLGSCPDVLWIRRKFCSVVQPFVQSEGDAMPDGTVLQSFTGETTARSQPC
jgi:hypothetical protein